MKNKLIKRGQGLPLNTIVLAALAIFILLLVLGFSSGSLSKLFSGFSKQTSTVDIQSARTECMNMCNTLKADLNSISGSATFDEIEDTYINSRYCKKMVSFGQNVSYCWDSPINVDCTIYAVAYNPSKDTYQRVVCKPNPDTDSCICSEV